MIDKRESQFWLEFRYPTTIIKDRYQGSYSGGKWLAFPMDYYQVPKDIASGDIECMMFWESYTECVGKGNTVEEAFSDLVVKMKKFMIHEEIVTFEVAKLAKEKGFNIHWVPFYALEDFTAEYVDDIGDFYEVDFEKGCLYPNYPIKGFLHKERMLPAPTQSLLQRWLREEKKMYVCPSIISDYEDDFHPDIVYWSFIIANTESGDSIYREYERIDDKRFATYELALEDALKYTLENLVN